MIPIQLTIEGLYSYQERQTIDFTQLTEAGLFGIFGAVGSGKSSILEAITYALYGESERMNTKDKQAYNMMNLKSSRLHVAFEFYNFENRKFRITRTSKRNSKQFDKIVNDGVVLYESIDNEWLPQPNSDVTEILGLNSENFRRTIIIPQGKFKEFIELGGTERTKMMKEIFGLQRFDLSDKIKSLYAENTSQLDQLTGTLQGFEAITEEHINDLNTQVAITTPLVDSAKTQLEKTEKKRETLLQLAQDFKAFETAKEALTIQAAQVPHFQKLEGKIQQYATAKELFALNIATEERLTNERKNKEAALLVEQNKLQKANETSEIVAKKWEILEPKIETIPVLHQKTQDFSLIQELLKLASENLHINSRVEKGKVKMQLNEELIEQLKNAKAQHEKALIEAKETRISPEELLNAQAWFTTKKNLQEKITAHEQQAIALQQQRNFSALLTSNGFSPENWQETIAQQAAAWKSSIQTSETQKMTLTVQQTMSQYATQLKSGEACPLCGSEHHPAVAHNTTVAIELAAIEVQLNKAKVEEKALDNLHQLFQHTAQQDQLIQDQLIQSAAQLKALTEQQVQHLATFDFPTLNQHDESAFEQLLKTAQAQQQTIEVLEKNCKTAQEEMDKTIATNQLYAQKIQDLISTEKANQVNFDNFSRQLQQLTFSEYSTWKAEEITAKIIQIKEEIQSISTQEAELKSLKEQLNIQRTEAMSVCKILSEDLAAIERNNTINQHDFEQKLSKSTFDTKEHILDILAESLQVNETLEQIKAFQLTLNSLQTTVNDYDKKLKGQTLNEQHFVEAEAELATHKVHYETLHQHLIVLKADIERKQLEFEKKRQFLQQFEQLSLRKENLSTMTGLFKSQGFVEYVSRIYLSNLCDMANIRFHKMTKNQLSLGINENNDFQVIDYLNDGKSRSVKTLSGGQSFQVALSLALALAENVQSLNQSSKNFFFIDEGFGTQDSESVNIVFETLQDLKKENRIVGIISHVDELKEKIPVSISVINDLERGSIVHLDEN